jgi:putative transposase
MSETRSISFKLYPTTAQAAVMDRKHAVLKDLWNAALEERINAYKHGVSVRLSDQEKSLKEIRLDVPGWRGLVHTHEAQIVLKRLDLAFQSFFRRVKAGARPGFPRFRSFDSFRGWGYKEHGNGFRVETRDGFRHGHVSLFGIGRMRMRGQGRTPGRVLKADVVRTGFGWMLNVVVETDCALRALATGPEAGLDWGVSTFATLALSDGTFEEVPNPRHYDAAGEELKAESRKLSELARSRKTGRVRLRRQRKALARRFAKLAARRKDFLHKVTARLAARHPLIVTEDLTVKNMTATARGTAQEPGRNVAQKAGLNRQVLDTAPSTFLNMLRYKAEEAGSEFILADTRRLKPSQRCPDCDAVSKKTLDLRRHDCACGCHLGRDEAAALVLLRWGQRGCAQRALLSGNSHPAGTVGVLAA